jgi:hypothetical protein
MAKQSVEGAICFLLAVYDKLCEERNKLRIKQTIRNHSSIILEILSLLHMLK